MKMKVDYFLLIRLILPTHFLWAIRYVRDQLYLETERDYHGPNVDPFSVHVHEAMCALDEYLVRMGFERKGENFDWW